jgi:hypothetical protein
MNTTRLSFGLLIILTQALSACAVLNPPPSAEAIERYGPYCEQLGHFPPYPDYHECIKRLEKTYTPSSGPY